MNQNRILYVERWKALAFEYLQLILHTPRTDKFDPLHQAAIEHAAEALLEEMKHNEAGAIDGS